jgi:hypothetical protein
MSTSGGHVHSGAFKASKPHARVRRPCLLNCAVLHCRAITVHVYLVLHKFYNLSTNLDRASTSMRGEQASLAGVGCCWFWCLDGAPRAATGAQ